MLGFFLLLALGIISTGVASIDFLAEKSYDFGTCSFELHFFGRFLEIFLTFLKNYAIKSEMKSSIERTGCENFPYRSGEEFFLQMLRPWRKFQYLKKILLSLF